MKHHRIRLRALAALDPPDRHRAVAQFLAALRATAIKMHLGQDDELDLGDLFALRRFAERVGTPYPLVFAAVHGHGSDVRELLGADAGRDVLRNLAPGKREQVVVETFGALWEGFDDETGQWGACFADDDVGRCLARRVGVPFGSLVPIGSGWKDAREWWQFPRHDAATQGGAV